MTTNDTDKILNDLEIMKKSSIKMNNIIAEWFLLKNEKQILISKKARKKFWGII